MEVDVAKLTEIPPGSMKKIRGFGQEFYFRTLTVRSSYVQ